MDKRRKRAASIIHSHALGASGLSAIFAQVALVNIPASTALMVSMFARLVKNRHPDADDMEEVAAGVGGLIVGYASTVYVVRSLVGLVPVLGNLANAALTFTLVETVGWALYAILEEGKDIRDMTEKEFKKYVKLGQRHKVDMAAAIKRLPPHVKVQYDLYVDQLKDAKLSDEARAEVQTKVEDLIDPYL